ncbi:hypothetical protein [Alistipes putredinis]|uniref:hypothetical protein n=1 Tax=Alistipes putredinis TaxID=28117 RepID=UPI003A8EB84D
MNPINVPPLKDKYKISFFDNIFYWLWTTAPLNGFPDRSFAIITFCQFSYILCFVSILLNLLDIEVQSKLYQNPKPVAIPVITILVTLLLINLNVYSDKKYHRLASDFQQIHIEERKKLKKKFHSFVVVTIIIILIDVVLLYLYNSHLTTIC